MHRRRGTPWERDAVSTGWEEEKCEKLWLESIKMIYEIKQQVLEELCAIDEKDLSNFNTFLLIRIQAFMMRMAEHVKLLNIIEFLQDIKGQENTYTYQEFQPTFEEKVKRETYHENILNNAIDIIQKDVIADVIQLNMEREQTKGR